MDDINELDVPVFLQDSANEDDWGDFGTAIAQLESQEAANDPTSDHSSDTGAAKSEALESLLASLFSLSESAISSLNGIEFAFDEQGKKEVISASIPVLNKYGDSLLDGFQYMEEVTLLIAVFALVMTSRKAIGYAKAQKRHDDEQGGTDGQEAA